MSRYIRLAHSVIFNRDSLLTGGDTNFGNASEDVHKMEDMAHPGAPR
jgi:hypothetical protein